MHGGLVLSLFILSPLIPSPLGVSGDTPSLSLETPPPCLWRHPLPVSGDTLAQVNSNRYPVEFLRSSGSGISHFTRSINFAAARHRRERCTEVSDNPVISQMILVGTQANVLAPFRYRTITSKTATSMGLIFPRRRRSRA